MNTTMLQRLLIVIQDLSSECQEIPLELLCEEMSCSPGQLTPLLEHLEVLGFIKYSLLRTKVILTEKGELANIPK